MKRPCFKIGLFYADSLPFGGDAVASDYQNAPIRAADIDICYRIGWLSLFVRLFKGICHRTAHTICRVADRIAKDKGNAVLTLDIIALCGVSDRHIARSSD